MRKSGEQLVREHYEAMNERAARRARIAELSRNATLELLRMNRELKEQAAAKKEGR